MSLVCLNGHQSEASDFCDTCGAKIDAAAQRSAEPSVAAPTGGTAAASTELACPHCGVDNPEGSLFCEACGYDFTTGAMPRGIEPPSSPTPDPGAGSAPVPTPDGGAVNSLDPFAEAPSGGTPPAAPPEAPEASAPEASAPEASAPEAAAPDPASAAGSAALAASSATGIPPAIPLTWVAEVWIDPEWYAGQEAEEPMPSPGLPVVVPLTVRSVLIGRVSASKNIRPDIDCTSDSGVSRRHAQLTTDGTRWFVEDLGSSNGTFVGGAGGALPDDPIPVGPKRELDEDDRIYVGAWTRIVVRRATDEERAAAAS